MYPETEEEKTGNFDPGIRPKIDYTKIDVTRPDPISTTLIYEEDGHLVGDVCWFDRWHYGYLPVNEKFDYNADYMVKYHEYEDTGKGFELNEARADLVDKYAFGEKVVDIGIGSGTFIKTREKRRQITFGYDVCPESINWLKDNEYWFDPTKEHFDNGTFWDAFEHPEDVSIYLESIRQYAFITLPIFADSNHILASKHYKPNEHVYYFTVHGLIRFMEFYQFDIIEYNIMEQGFGREEIGTFVFKRKG